MNVLSPEIDTVYFIANLNVWTIDAVSVVSVQVWGGEKRTLLESQRKNGKLFIP